MIGWIAKACYSIGMEPKQYIIYTDMDGTMLTDWSFGPVVPERNLAALHAFIHAGGAVSLATGRQVRDSLAHFPDILFSAPLVLNNGACVYSQSEQRVLYMDALPTDALREAAEFTLRRDDVFLVTADAYGMYRMQESPEKDRRLNDSVNRVMLRPEEIIQTLAAKMCFVVNDPAVMPQIWQEVRKFSAFSELTVMQSAPIYMEIVNKGVSKSNGIRKAIEIAGFADRTLVCIGDYMNDKDMLATADIAACPANAVQEIQEICQIAVCSNNEGAFAEVIERLP